jgi:hypothetical protein
VVVAGRKGMVVVSSDEDREHRDKEEEDDKITELPFFLLVK